MNKFAILLIDFYQKYLSFDKSLGRMLALSPSVCRFSPTCSEYSKQAIEKYGILKGTFLGIKRIAKCHPGNIGGWDPVK